MSGQGDPLFLESAWQIGARLCRDVFWHAGRCALVGPGTELVAGEYRVVPRSPGPELYEGSAGTALFLAHLYRCTGEKIFRHTAEGAARQALALVGELDPGCRLGFYAGIPGIAYSCFELGACTGDERWTAAGLRLLHGLETQIHSGAPADVVLGLAGALAGLVHACRRPFGADLLPLALRCGEALREAAVPQSRGLAWLGLVPGPALTGFSHGAAGIAWALLELYDLTREKCWRDLALAAFDYERSRFDGWRQNWPDLREPEAPTWPFYWCHGAPGIGLTRFRAFEILGDPALAAEGELALRSTLVDLQNPESNVRSHCLCHGQLGNAELLLFAGTVLGQRALAGLAAAVAYQVLDNFARQGRTYTSGLRGGGEAWGLLTGNAGIGHFFLRLHDPARTPPILILPSGGRAAVQA